MDEKERIKGKYFKRKKKRSIYEDLTKFLEKNYSKGKKVLDLGSGCGVFSKYAKDMGYDVSSCDYNMEYCIYEDLRIDFCDLNKGRLPYPDKEFDLVLLAEVIEHIYNPGAVLSEISRVLKPGGKLYLSTPNLVNWKNKASFLLRSHFLTHPENPKIGDHITHIPPSFIRSFLDRSDFSDIRIRYISSTIPFTTVRLPDCSALSDTVVAEAARKKEGKKRGSSRMPP